MKRMKCFRWLVVTLLCFFGLSAEAEGVDDVITSYQLIIEFESGDSLIFELNDKSKPQLLFSPDKPDKMTVKADKLKTDLDLKDKYKVTRISFVEKTNDPIGPDDPTSVDEIKNVQDKTITVKFTDSNTFEVYGIDGKSSVMVYSLDGMMMPLDAECSDNAVVVHLNGYKNGTYIIKIGKQAYKVIKR